MSSRFKPFDCPGVKPIGSSYIRRKSSEIRKILPKSPRKAVQVLKHLWDQVYRSPRKRDLMDKMWSKDRKIGKFMYLVGKYKNRKNVSKLTETVSRIKKQYKSLRSACRYTDMHWSHFQKCTKLSQKKMCNRKYIRKLETSQIASIGSFFSSDEASFPLPDKKYAGKRFMKRSLSRTCKMYNLLETTRRKVSDSTLRKYMPRFVKLQGKIPFRQSCCEVCQNFEYVINNASRYLSGIPQTIDACIDSSICDYNTYFPRLNCALRECEHCSTDNLRIKLEELNSEKLQDHRKRFLVKQWFNKKEKISGSDKYRTYIHWRHDRLSYRDLLYKYLKLLENMASHSFFAAWNFHQYLVCKNNLEKGQVLMVHDFAQNYLCLHQHEVQAMHWCHQQVTIHPSCVTYRCPIQGCNQLVLHEIVHISDDLKHDAHLVKKFQAANIQVLKKRGVDIRKIIEFTDQAPSQYKNKTAFRYLSDEDTPKERNFFGVRHGKGPCDACAGRFKHRLSQLVKTQTCVINTPKTCFEAAKEHIETKWPNKDECMHYMLTCNYSSKIPKRPNTSSWKGVRDTREHMHSIMNTGKHLQINVRDVVCLCPGCLNGTSDCKNSDYCDNWRGFNMNTYTDIEPNLDRWASVVIRKTVGDRADYDWSETLTELAAKNSFEELLDYAKKNPVPFLDCHINNILSENDRDHLDLVALHYRPPDAPDDFVPCKIGSDGNCFPRTLSFLCFRTQENHVEMRVRLVYEAVLNAKYYISNRYLSRGCNIIYRRAGPCKQIAMYSTFYDPSIPLDVVDIYKREVLDVAKDGTYCGLWQIAQASNILRRPVMSIYPLRLHDGMRLDFNREFMCIDNKYNEKISVKIMWTPMQVGPNRYPVHFVPLLKAVSVIRKIRDYYQLVEKIVVKFVFHMYF